MRLSVLSISISAAGTQRSPIGSGPRNALQNSEIALITDR